MKLHQIAWQINYSGTMMNQLTERRERRKAIKEHRYNQWLKAQPKQTHIPESHRILFTPEKRWKPEFSFFERQGLKNVSGKEKRLMVAKLRAEHLRNHEMGLR